MNSPRQKSERTLGILCILCAAFCFSLMSLFVRLAGNIPTMQKIFFRNLVAAIAAFVILAREGQGFRIHKGCLGGHLARSITGMLGMVANFWAIDHIGMADANMLNKLSPFFAILFSIFILREYPKKVDILSVLAAFIGAVFVVRPTAGIASLPSLAGVLGGLGAGAAYTFVRQMSRKGERGPEIVMFFSAFTCVCAIPFFAFNFQPMSARSSGSFCCWPAAPRPEDSFPLPPRTATPRRRRSPCLTIRRSSMRRSGAFSSSARSRTR